MQTPILAHEINRFNGIEIRSDTLPNHAETFRSQLEDSLQEWQGNGHRVVWLELPIERSQLIPLATAAGFVFHHSTERSLTLLHTFEGAHEVPFYATHYIGAGGVVFNDANELLTVSEWHRRDRSRPYYKLPGGALKPGEHLVDGVIREVLEETGVVATFETLVCFRHWHGYRWNKSDIYFICRLRALSSEITPQPTEIEEAKWMPVEEYLTSEYVSPFNKRVLEAALGNTGLSPELVQGYTDPQRYEFFMP